MVDGLVEGIVADELVSVTAIADSAAEGSWRSPLGSNAAVKPGTAASLSW